jgi:hypothetical protein
MVGSPSFKGLVVNVKEVLVRGALMVKESVNIRIKFTDFKLLVLSLSPTILSIIYHLEKRSLTLLRITFLFWTYRSTVHSLPNHKKDGLIKVEGKSCAMY